MATYIGAASMEGNILQAERVVDITPREVFWLEKEITPLLHFTAGGKNKKGLPSKRRQVKNADFKILTKPTHANWTAINDGSNYTAGDVTLTVDSTAHMKVHDRLKDARSNELLRVTSITNATTVVVARAQGATTAAAINDNDPLLTLGSMREEFGEYGPMKIVKNEIGTNYAQAFEFNTGISVQQENSEHYGGDKKAELRQEAVREFKKRVERDFHFGEPFYDQTGGPSGNAIWGTGGIFYWAAAGSAYTMTVTVTFTRSMWTTYARNCFAVEGRSMTKLCLCSPMVIDALEFWKGDKLRFKPDNRAYDLRVAEWNSGNGTLLIARDPLLQNSTAGDTTLGWGGAAIAFEPEQVEYRYLGDLDMKYYMNVKQDGSYGKFDRVFGQIGIWVENPGAMGVLRGVATYS